MGERKESSSASLLSSSFANEKREPPGWDVPFLTGQKGDEKSRTNRH
jgi:hypothetical protein